MTKTILITGTSSGLGRATAKLFQAHGWNVVATMRSQEKEAELNNLENVLVTRLDVQDIASIQGAVTADIARFGRVDVQAMAVASQDATTSFAPALPSFALPQTTSTRAGIFWTKK